jgi:hypothetical protein
VWSLLCAQRRCLSLRVPLVALMPGDVLLEGASGLFRAPPCRFGGVAQALVFVPRHAGGTSVLHHRFRVQAGRGRELISQVPPCLAGDVRG